MNAVAYLLIGILATVVAQEAAKKLLKFRPFFHPEEHIKTQGSRPTLGWRRVKSRVFKNKHLFEMAFDIVPILDKQHVVVAAQWRFPRLDEHYFNCSFKERLGRAFIRSRRPYKDVGPQEEYSALNKEHGIEIMRSYWRKSKKLAGGNLHIEFGGPDLPPSIPIRYLSPRTLFFPKIILRCIQKQYSITDVSLIDARHNEDLIKTDVPLHIGSFSDDDTSEHQSDPDLKDEKETESQTDRPQKPSRSRVHREAVQDHIAGRGWRT